MHATWAQIAKDGDGQVERLACWKVVLADKELASIVGNGSVSRGTSVLQAMKEVRALDQMSRDYWVKQDGRICEVSAVQENYRLETRLSIMAISDYSNYARSLSLSQSWIVRLIGMDAHGLID